MNELCVESYLEAEVSTASAAKLVLVVYEGALRFLRQARAALERGDYPAAVRAGVRVQRIMSALTAALDPPRAPELAENLEKVYDWVSRQAADAVARKEPSLLDAPERALEELYKAWKQVISG